MRRRLIAVVAAYAFALQAVLTSFAALLVVGAVPGLCAPGGPRQPGSDPGRSPPCIACPALCGDGGLPGVAPAGVVTVARRSAAVRDVHPVLRLAERSAPRNLPPSRAPPAA